MQSFPQLLMGPSNVRFEIENDNFDSALALHIFKNPDYLVLFKEATLIPTINGLPQSFKEATEKKKAYKQKFGYK